tara:strand:+ start:1096 stop:1845 length:750 start_codon:yes stop_codon:yes gene_type:complete
MNDYIICIPSFNRYKTIGNNTLNMLKENNIPKNKIEIYVVDEEYENYKTLYNDYKIVRGIKGLCNQRNFILLNNKNKNIIFIDDDVTHLYKKNNNKCSLFYDFKDIIELGFKTCLDENTKIFGLYPVWNGLFMKDTITTDLKFIQGCLFGIINDENNIIEWQHDNAEDSARTLHYYDIYKKTIRINYIVPKTEYKKNKGGLQSIYTKEQREKELKNNFILLKEKYPKFCNIYSKKNGDVNIKIHHYKSR